MAVNNEKVEDIVKLILNDYEDGRQINSLNMYAQPDKEAIIDIIKKLLKIVYPGFYNDNVYKSYGVKNNMSATIEDVIYRLKKQIGIVYHYCNLFPQLTEKEIEEKAMETTLKFMETIPKIREYLNCDVKATYDGDPAAFNETEIIMAYPGVFAISIFRLAHELHLLEIPMIPRIMTEYAHNKTGIDIHPGATIGKYFCIDHGTGIVIGETTTIGCHVKLYQGVTLGALSTRGGHDLTGAKRHPTIKDNVTIYSNASILGGNTVIESDVVVGGNTFVTQSITKGQRVSAKAQELQIKE